MPAPQPTERPENDRLSSDLQLRYLVQHPFRIDPFRMRVRGRSSARSNIEPHPGSRMPIPNRGGDAGLSHHTLPRGAVARALKYDGILHSPRQRRRADQRWSPMSRQPERCAVTLKRCRETRLRTLCAPGEPYSGTRALSLRAISPFTSISVRTTDRYQVVSNLGRVTSPNARNTIFRQSEQIQAGIISRRVGAGFRATLARRAGYAPSACRPEGGYGAIARRTKSVCAGCRRWF